MGGAKATRVVVDEGTDRDFPMIVSVERRADGTVSVKIDDGFDSYMTAVLPASTWEVVAMI
jgi:hypothetical protein